MKFSDVFENHMNKVYPIRDTIDRIYKENEDYEIKELKQNITTKLSN